jgi:hypothetical protein
MIIIEKDGYINANQFGWGNEKIVQFYSSTGGIYWVTFEKDLPTSHEPIWIQMAMNGSLKNERDEFVRVYNAKNWKYTNKPEMKTPIVPGSDFDGVTFNPALDGARLNKQLQAVFDYMRDGQWRTLGEISEAKGFPQASISARLRDLRKPKFGGHVVSRRHRGEASLGLYEYRLEVQK